MRYTPFPNGARIRKQIGGRYYLLPTGRFECAWHRRHTTLDQIREHAERTRTWFSLPCERAEAWGAPSVRAEALDGLEIIALPDGLQVFVIPALDRIGVVLRDEWTSIKKAGRSARGPILRHAYQTSLGRFQRWRAVGPDVLKTIHDRTRAIREERSNEHQERRLAHEDNGLADWIFVHGRSLYCAEADPDEKKAECMGLIASCAPHKMATAAVVAATGYEPDAIASAAHRTGKGHPSRGLEETSIESEDSTSDEENPESES